MSHSVQNKRIMIIDDQAFNLKVLDKMLRAEGYTNLELIPDSRDTIDLYKKKRPDLIMLDLNMPHLDGYQIMEELKKIDGNNTPPIVVLTAQSSKEHKRKAEALGAKEFITKPLDLRALTVKIEALLKAS